MKDNIIMDKSLNRFYIGVTIIFCLIGALIVFALIAANRSPYSNSVPPTPPTLLKTESNLAISYSCFPKTTLLDNDGYVVDTKSKELSNVSAFEGYGKNNVTFNAFKNKKPDPQLLEILSTGIYCRSDITDSETTDYYVVAKRMPLKR